MFRPIIAIACLVVVAVVVGCESDRQTRVQPSLPLAQRLAEPSTANAMNAPRGPAVQLAAHQDPPEAPQPQSPQPLPSPLNAHVEEVNPGATGEPIESLEALEVLALTNNPTLRRMQHEAAAEWEQTGYVSKLPDPTISSMFYLPPMNYDPDRLVAELQVMQMIPWVGRLKAEAQQAHLEALAAENAFLAERLRVVADVRMNWYRLYVLGKQIETTEADQAQLESLIKTANARVATGDAQPGDVLMGTLELSSLQ